MKPCWPNEKLWRVRMSTIFSGLISNEKVSMASPVEDNKFPVNVVTAQGSMRSKEFRSGSKRIKRKIANSDGSM